MYSSKSTFFLPVLLDTITLKITFIAIGKSSIFGCTLLGKLLRRIMAGFMSGWVRGSCPSKWRRDAVFLSKSGFKITTETN